MPKTPESGPNTGAGPVLSWFGAMLCAWALAACVTVTVLGGTSIMDEGGFVASGGPYEIAHPVPEGFWLMPVAFVGMFAFAPLHALFASRIRGFALIFATWCALWTAVGGTTLWYGVRPPAGDGLVWGWIAMGAIFLLVGVGSGVMYVKSLFIPDPERAAVPGPHRIAYLTLTLLALAGGTASAFPLFAAVVG